MRLVTPADVDRLAFGAMLLSSGAAGTEENVVAVTLMLREALATHGPVRVLEPDEADPDALGVRVAIVGSPVLLREKPPSGAEIQEALRILEADCGERASAVIGWEMEGNNGLVPLILAAQTGLPVVDVDGMGRAFPRIDQSTYAVAGLPITPLAITEPGGDRAVLESSSIEQLARLVTVDFGGWAVMACRPLRIADAVAAGVPGAWARALELGERWLPERERSDPAPERERAATAAARRVGTGPASPEGMAERARASGGFLLARGKVTEVQWETSEGFPHGTAVVQDLDDDESFVRLEMQGEYLVALANGEPVVTCPDIICCLDAETGRVVGTARVRCGCVIDVVALPAPAQWMCPAALRRVNPRAFGYDLDYVPLGALVGGPTP